MGVARKLLERASRQLELPAEIVAGLPRIEVTGTGEPVSYTHLTLPTICSV